MVCITMKEVLKSLVDLLVGLCARVFSLNSPNWREDVTVDKGEPMLLSFRDLVSGEILQN